MQCTTLATMPNDDLIGSSEAARILKVHPATITRWVADGVLEPVRRLPAMFLFRRADVEALASERRSA